MLRVSIQVQGNDVDLSAIRDGTAKATESGIAHADLLLAFAEALVAHDEPELAKLRGPLIETVGPDGFLEAATVAANFQRMVRIADSTGIPQDAPVMALAGDVIDDLGLRSFPSANNTPAVGLLQRILGRVFRPFAARLMTAAANRMAAGSK